jgi:hypothetical protein
MQSSTVAREQNQTIQDLPAKHCSVQDSDSVER